MKRAAIILTAIIVFTAVLPVTMSYGEEESYTTEVTLIYQSSSGTRTATAVTYEEGVYPFLYSDLIYTEAPADEAYLRYISGETDAMDAYRVENPVSGNMYYIYQSINGSNLSSYFNLIHFDIKPDTITLMPGTYTIKADVNNSRVSSVYLNIADINGWGNITLNVGEEETITVVRPTAYCIYHTAHGVGKVDGSITLSKAPLTGNATVVSGETTDVASQYLWRSAEIITDGNVECSYNYGEEFYFVEKGSDEEKRFLDEVINRGDVTFDATEYRLADALPMKPGTYTVYSLDDYINYYREGLYQGTYSLEPVNDYRDSAFYMGAYNSFTIAVDYDDSNCYLMLKSSLGNLYVLDPNTEYTIDVTNPAEYWLEARMMYPTDGTADHITVSMSLEGAPSPDGNAMVLAAVLILLCVIVFGLLFVSGLKPKWSKK